LHQNQGKSDEQIESPAKSTPNLLIPAIAVKDSHASPGGK
jgi:hypothetical protein